MTFEKFHGTTIEEARRKARQKLGKTYIVVESREAANGKPAWVNVLNEARPYKTDTYSRQDLFPRALTKLKKTLNESLPLFNVENRESGSHSFQRKPSQNVLKPSPLKNVRTEKDGEHSLKTEQNASFKNDIQTLAQRFDQLEQRLSGQAAQSNNHYASHPAFQQLLASGVPHATAASWFDEIVKSGVNIYDESGDFRQLLADKIKRALDVAAGDEPAKVMLFAGSSAAGKSSLIMKLALRFTLLNGANCGLISVYPAKRENYYSPLAEFTSAHDLAHYIVQDMKDLLKLKGKWPEFDHLFIEMLPEKRQKAAKLSINNFKEILAIEYSFPFEIHHVVNAMLNQACLDRQHFFKQHSVPQYLDFTHLDETPLRGHLLPIMQQPGCKVRYVTAGPRIPDDISVYEPAHFARKLLVNM